MPENDDYAFAIWSDDRNGKLVWYRPGDTIEAGAGKTLEALYLNKNWSSIIIIIDDNSGKAANNSNYYIVYNYLDPYKLPTAAFNYSGHTLNGFNTKADDTAKITIGGLFLNLSVSALGKEIHDVSGTARYILTVWERATSLP